MAEAVAGRLYRDVEDDILRMEAKLPGFGGLFVDSTGTVVVYGPPNLSADEVRAAMAEHAPEFHLLPEHQAQLTASDRVRVLPAQYSFSQLLAWQQGLASRTGPSDGVVALDADEGRNRVGIGAVDGAAGERLLTLAATLGIPREALESEIMQRPMRQRGLKNVSTAAAPTRGGVVDSFLTNTLGKLRAGAEISVVGGGGACTMGFVVGGGMSGQAAILSAGHCANDHGDTGDSVRQNEFGPVIGAVMSNVPYSWGVPVCGNFNYCIEADAMVIDPTIWALGTQLLSAGRSRWNTPSNDTKITGTTTIIGEQVTYQGLGIMRVGKVTGTTTGVVDTMGTGVGGVLKTCVAITASNGTRYTCLARVKNNKGQGGDSGGPVLSSGGNFAVGLHTLGDGSCTTPCYTHYTSINSARAKLGFGNAW